MFRVTKSADQRYDTSPLIAEGPYPAVFAKVTFDTVEYQSGAYVNDRYVVPTTGVYSFGAQVMFTGTAGYGAELLLAVNGHIHSRLAKDTVPSSVDWISLQGSAELQLTAGSTVELWVFFADRSTASYIRGNTPTYGYRNTSFFGHRIDG